MNLVNFFSARKTINFTHFNLYRLQLLVGQNKINSKVTNRGNIKSVVVFYCVTVFLAFPRASTLHLAVAPL